MMLNNIDKSSVMEIQHPDHIQVMPHMKRQHRFCEMDDHQVDALADPDALAEFELQEDERLSEPENQKAKIFYLRFFEKMPYDEIGDICNITKQAAMKTYHSGRKRVEEVLIHMDQAGAAKTLIKRKGKMTDTQKMVVCKVVLGLTFVQISNLFGGKFSRKSIQWRVNDFKSKHQELLRVCV